MKQYYDGKKIGLGKIGEMVLNSMLRGVFNDGYRIKSNDFKNYNNGISKGVDFKIWLGSCLLFAIEAKNWRNFKKPYGKDIIENEIIARFRNCEAKYKVLIISFENLLSKEGHRMLRDAGIEVFSLNKLLGRKLFKNKLYFQLKVQLQQFINDLRAKVLDYQSKLNTELQTLPTTKLDTLLLELQSELPYTTNIEIPDTPTNTTGDNSNITGNNNQLPTG